MEEDIHLSTEAIKIIKSFELAIDKTKIWNDDKIYLSYLPKALLSENYIWATSIGFIFLEKYLRTTLIFEIHKKSKNPWEEFFHALDRIEKEIENWEHWWDRHNWKYQSFNNSLKKYWVDKTITREMLMKELNDYLSFIESEWPLPKWQFSFNNICCELRKHWVINWVKEKELKSLYSKYRTTVQHWLFKRLVDSLGWDSKTPVVRSDWIDIKMINVDKSNLLLRQFIIIPMFKEISILIFNEIYQLMVELWDIEAN